MIFGDIVLQIIRYQAEHGGRSPQEHWIDGATWRRGCNEFSVSLSWPDEGYRCGAETSRQIMGIPVRIWDE